MWLPPISQPARENKNIKHASIHEVLHVDQFAKVVFQKCRSFCRWILHDIPRVLTLPENHTFVWGEDFIHNFTLESFWKCLLAYWIWDVRATCGNSVWDRETAVKNFWGEKISLFSCAFYAENCATIYKLLCVVFL